MIVGALSLAIWLYLLLARGGFWRMREAPPPSDAAPPPSVVAVIPARNEAEVVGRAVASLARQEYGGRFHIVLVDDASTDSTAEAAGAAAPPALLTVIRARALPAGWTGKLWAAAQGVRHAASLSPDYFLLTDADIVHPPDALRRLTARAAAGFDLVSYMAKLRCQALAERALIPAFVFFFFMLYPPAWIADPRRGTAGAAGGCILIRAAVLAQIGGLEAIRGELIDDCALAREVKRAGGRIWLGLSAATASIRPYPSFGDIGRMISRTAFTQLGHSPWLLAGTLVGLAVTFLAPPALALSALALSAQPQAAALGLAAWLSMSLAYWPMLRFYRCSPLWGAFWAPLLPLGAAFYLGATVHSALSYWRGAGGQWKGRAQDRQ